MFNSYYTQNLINVTVRNVSYHTVIVLSSDFSIVVAESHLQDILSVLNEIMHNINFEG